MNPDPDAPFDPDTPLRLDHVPHFLTSLTLSIAVIGGVTAAALFCWRLRSPETYEDRFATRPPAFCAGDCGHTSRGKGCASVAGCQPQSRSLAWTKMDGKLRGRAGIIQDCAELKCLKPACI
ncbi:hypothetical protein I546_7256 [Mycobacterium kansasii 732]|nr:hypothetical protein I546_7256 [Mycobacterium kansasii 732]